MALSVRVPFSLVATLLMAWLMLAEGLAREAEYQGPGQARAAAATDGRPNLEGLWAYGTATPLERPEQFAGQVYFSSDAEADQFRKEAEAARRAVLASRLGVPEFAEDEQPFVVERGRKPTSLIREPADGRIPYLNPSVQRRPLVDRLAGPTDFPLSERCVKGQAAPPILPNAGPPYLQIIQADEFVSFLQEGHDVRLVPLEPRLAQSRVIRRWYGASHGRWDRAQLVVETSAFRDQQRQRNSFVRFDQNLRVIERFSLVDSNTLWYEFTVDDPTVFAKPWSGGFSMRRQASMMYEFACHEGNYALPNALSGARAEEQSGALDK